MSVPGQPGSSCAPAGSLAGRADLGKIAAAIGGVPRVSYEAAHVYPLSAPTFARHPGTAREQPPPGPLKLYVHVPFCNYACTFCFYAKRVGASRRQMERYVAALERELGWVAAGTPLAQLYIGGGTPTVLPADLLGRVLDAVAARLPPLASASLTVETSPESLTAAHIDALAAHGVGRVSMGIESLSPEVLASVNRRHGADEALAGCAQLVRSGFFVNADLMYGFPGQGEASFRADLEAVAASGSQSISLYNLRLNERTPLARVVSDLDRLDLPALLHWRELASDVMDALGFEQVRWHTFVRRDVGPAPGFDRAPCVDGCDAGRQLGIGLSAVSHLGQTIYRNHENFEPYVTCIEEGESPVEGVFTLRDDADRRILFVVRTLGDGRALSRQGYEGAFGHAIEDDFGDVLARLGAADLVADEEDSLVLTPTGRLVYDLVTLAFYPLRARQWLAGRQQLL